MRLSSISVEAYKEALAKRARESTANILDGASSLGIPAPASKFQLGIAHTQDNCVDVIFGYAQGRLSFQAAERFLKVLRRAVSLILWAEDSPQSTLDTHLGLDDMLALPLMAAEARRACELGQPVRTAYLAAAGGVTYQEINRLCRAGKLVKAVAPKCITAKSASAWLANRGPGVAPAPESKPAKARKGKKAAP